MSESWYITIDGQKTFGPYSLAQLQEFVAAGHLQRGTKVWQEGTAAWIDAQQVTGLFVGPSMPPMPAFPSLPGYPVKHTVELGSSEKLSAGLCGILVGALGIHKFILGMTTPGLVMLLVTICTLGLGGIPMGIIGLVEGIIYLTKSDDEFYQTYVIGKRPWF